MKSLQKFVKDNSLDFQTPAMILGSAPSVEIVKNFEFTGVRIGVGDMPVRGKRLGFYDYWVTANTYYPLPWNKKHAKDIERSRSITMIASMSAVNASTDTTIIFNQLREIAESSNYVLYDQRHFSDNACDERDVCCAISDSLIEGPSIQELLGLMVHEISPAYSEGSTVALHGYALAVLLKSSPIYIAGVELPVDNKNYKAYRNFFRPRENLFMKTKRIYRDFLPSYRKGSSDFGVAGQALILDDFKQIAAIASRIGIKTYSLSPTSPLNSIEEIEFLKVF